MNENPNIPLSPQAEASDPRSSAWVSANAGSGKTTVLVWRVIRLLLDGVPPGRILCLTYTKAAAAHMANKVLEKLSAWVRLDDEALDAAIAEIEPGRPSPQRRARARRLFSAALETPGGLKVQTIHAFCDRVLHMFPVEADAPAGFEVLDDLGERDMIENARLQVLLDAGRNPESSLGKALAHCIEISGDDTIEKVIQEAVRARQSLRAFEIETARAAMVACLGLDANDTLQSLSSKILDGRDFPRSEWESVARAMEPLGGHAAKTAAKLFAAARAEGSEALEAYISVFCNDKGEPRDDKGFGAEKALAAIPGLRERLFRERERIAPLVNSLKAARECERSCALLTIASAVVKRYEEAKRRRGVLDFADLVTKTVELLEREESAWVHFKLDGGIEHILVDEAQDTSPEQWRIIAKLAEEFFAGKGASERSRTIFAVGDEKQSIFSFQGADPVRFDEMRRQFATEIAAAGQSLREPRLRRSYRSTAVVLGAVDTVFNVAEAREGLSAHNGEGPMHEAVRQSAPGMVEIWPEVRAFKSTEEEDGWDKPLDRIPESSAQMRLAKQIAQAVKQWINGGLTVGDRNRDGERPRAVTAGDIIVLVQSRGTLFDAILRALKREGLPVAGADRLRLTENIAVMDLIALGDALLLLEDDLSLASVLKSPLFGFSDEDLFALCHGRSGTLMESLSASAEARHVQASQKLAGWRELALHLRPFDFYSRVLGRDGGRRKMVARLGPEAADALDEFLAAALSYEATETPSLHGFLSLLRRTESEIKRDFEAEGESVRVMTVHGVKGLEAPVIVLADTTTLPPPQKEPNLVAVGEEGNVSLVWRKSKDDASPAMRRAREAARTLRLQEYRRLLYVALTRAADVLVVCGALNKKLNAAERGSWYDLVRSALTADPKNVSLHKTAYCPEEVWRWGKPEFPPLAMARKAEPLPEKEMPSWLAQPFQAKQASLVRLRPSHLPGNFSREGAAAGDGGKARGILLHRLLQSLPSLAHTEREAAALRYLAQAAPTINETSRAKIVREVMDVLAHPDCAEIFGPGSQAEPELFAQLREQDRVIEIPARLDRIMIANERVVFADFKSDAKVPASLMEIPARYIAQLAAYRAALLHAFPGRDLQALLIFTAAPRIFEIPSESLESAWQRLKTQDSPAIQ